MKRMTIKAKNQHPAGHVQPQNGNLVRVGVGHRREPERPYDQCSGDQDGKHPMQRHQQRMIAGHLLQFQFLLKTR